MVVGLLPHIFEDGHEEESGYSKDVQHYCCQVDDWPSVDGHHILQDVVVESKGEEDCWQGDLDEERLEE